MVNRNRPDVIESNPWGPHREAVVDGVVSCADYLGRLERSLVGEAATDRHYFAMRAGDLYQSARDLVRLVEETEHALIVCEGTMFWTDERGSYGSQCELPRNHYGGHDDRPPASLAVQVRDRARELMDRAEWTAAWVNRLGLQSDQRRAFGMEKEFDPEFHEIFLEIEEASRSLHHQVKIMGTVMEKLVYEAPQEEWDEMDRYVDEDEDDELGLDQLIIPVAPTPPLPPVRRPRGLDL